MKATSMDRTSKPRPALRLVSTKGLPREAMSSTLEIIHKYHIISAQISAWEKPF
nr:hypothetical protein [Pseudomonas mendocina]